MSYLIILDCILFILSKPENDKLTNQQLETLLYMHPKASMYIKEVDIAKSISRLIDDNYVKAVAEDVIVEIFKAGTITYLSITSQGYSFMKLGGYYGTLQSELSLQEENRRLRESQIDLNKSIRLTNRWMIWLTSIIAFGTIMASIYYGFEIYHLFCPKSP
ncbi:hypothetical protein [Flavobacterium anhuiense]|uniref:hypothetical protein n=1 Tax=Flavobacterium anhuiense TaxID=459526 RepID=UPI0034D9866D